MKATIIRLFERDWQRLSNELDAYAVEEQIWTKPGSISNSAGHLLLHLCCNLRHFIGAVLGNSGYVRNREKEFSSAPVPREELRLLLSACQTEVLAALDVLPEEKLQQEYPLEVLDRRWETEDFLIHLLTHLSYHLGQINYHRRMQDC